MTLENSKDTFIDRRNFLKFGFLSTAAALTSSCSMNAQEQPAANASKKVEEKEESLKPPINKYLPKDYSNLLGALDGISDKQLTDHFKLYKKYISKINLVESKIANYNLAGDMASYRPLLVAQTYMLNGAVLHELYFGNLGATDKEPSGMLRKLINRDFGGVINFIGHLKAAGKAARGWAVAAYNYRTGKINVYGLDAHNELVPSLAYPILALDVYEHAYMIDYSIDRGKYLDAFVSNLNWRPVQDRLELAMSIPFGDLTTT